jgi:hypothetical protein
VAVRRGMSDTARLILTAGSRDLEISEHALLRMARREVSVPQLEEALRAQPFQYYHEGVWKAGYYDPVSRIFVGELQGKVLTVISDVKPQYIENLLRAKP